MRFFISPILGHMDGQGHSKYLDKALALLVAIEECGNLRSASQSLGISYRHAWNLLSELEQRLGGSAVEMTRGRGSELSELGHKLVWANKQIQARLGPLLDSMASEIDAQIQITIPEGDDGALRLFASHGFAVEALHQRLAAQQHELEINYRGSIDAVAALNRGMCDIAGFHVPQGALMAPILEKYTPLFKPSFRLVCLATRRQGMMVAKGNPMKIWDITDLKRSGIKLVNRQQNSGTRMLLELLLAEHHVNKQAVAGFESVEYTHAAVAAYVASHKADVGIGVETAARQFGLDFVPLLTERYFLVFDQKLLRDSRLSDVLDTMASNEFKAAISELPGYDPSLVVDILSLSEAFPAFELFQESTV